MSVPNTPQDYAQRQHPDQAGDLVADGGVPQGCVVSVEEWQRDVVVR